MNDTQTAFVQVPGDHDGDYAASGLTPEMIEAGRDFLYNYFGQPLVDLNDRMVVVGVYRAALSAAPKPPESEIGPVANYLLGDAHRRIEADRAIIAELRAEVERLQSFADGYGKLDADFAIAERRAEVADVCMKIQRENMDLRDAFLVERGLWADFVDQLPASPSRAAFASKKETVDGDRPDDIPQDLRDYAEAAEKARRELPLPGAIEHHARAIDQARREGYAAGVALGAEAMTDEALLGLLMRLTAGQSHPDVIRHQITKWRADVAQKETP